MRHVTTCILALLLGLGAVNAQADADSGLYIGAGLGQFNVEVDNLDDAGDVASGFDGDDTSWKIFGGYRFNPYFGVELDYIDFGGPEDQGIEVGISGIAPYLVATLPFANIFEVSAHLGYYFYDVDIDTDFGSDSSSDEDLVYGASFAVVFAKKFDLRLTYEIIDVSDVDDANALWLSGAFHF